jgi:Flp pilus assembly protein TadD
MVRPASPGWARFLADYSADAGVRADILRLSERHPRDPIIQMAAASCLIQARQYEAAIRKLDSVLERLPASSRAWSLGSVALRGAGRPAEAYRAAVKAADLEPQHAVPLLNLGVTAAQMGDWAAAAGFFERAVAVAESKEIQAAACYDLGMLHARLGRYEDAARSLERAVRAVPSDAAAHAELGAALMALGRREEAERSLRKSLELDPSNESARKALGTLRGQ